MSFRANSLRCVLLDSACYVVALGTATAALTSYAQQSEPRTEQVQETTDGRLTDDQVDRQLNTEDSTPSGNPVESPEAKREAMMLGMKLYEVGVGNIRVEDVAATSPAWDAGIRKGDRLVSIDSVKPRSLAPWVQDMGRILKDTPDGKAIAAAVERDGESLSLRIRVPVSNAAEVRDARQEERAIANMASGNGQQMEQLGQQGVMPAAGTDMGGGAAPYGGYGGVGGWGLGGFFGDGGSPNGSGDRMATNAVARLMAVNTFGAGTNAAAMTSQTTGRQQQGGQPQQAQGGQPSGGQIGVAGFQNNGQGVRAAVVVRGLPPGMYQVGIGQGGGAGGIGNGGFGAGIGTDGSMRNGQGNFDGRNGQRSGGAGGLNDFDPNGAANPNQSMPQGARPIDRPGVQQPTNNQRPQTPFFPQRPSPGGSTVPAGGTPAGGTGGGSATGGTGGASGASLANPKGLPILAQQLDATADASLNNPSHQGARQPAQAGNPISAGNSNQSPGGTMPNGNSANRNNFPAGTNPMGGMGGPQFVAEIGVLRVGEDGSGRVENQLEGMQVQNLAGMSVMVVSPQAQAAAAGQGGVGSGRFPASAEGPQDVIGRPDGARNQQAQGTGGAGMGGVVATGVIQIVEGGAGGNTGVGLDDPATQSGNQSQDNSATDQLRDRNRIDQPADFDPRSTQR